MSFSPTQAYRRGITSMSLAMGFFLINDSMVKLITARAPADQIICIRGSFVALFITLWVAATRPYVFRFIAHRGMAMAGVRGMMDALSSFSFVGSLFFLALPNATAINLSGPLIVTGFAILFLGEKVAWRQWVAILVGMGGVALIVQPAGEAFNWFSLLALFGTACTAIRDVLTRSIGMQIPASLLTLATGVVVAAVGGTSGLIRGWPPIALGDVAVLCVASLFMIAGQQFTIYALRIAEASAVAPFRYTSILWSMFLGYMLWGDLPNGLALVGIAVVVLSGLYLLQLERRRRRLLEEATAVL